MSGVRGGELDRPTPLHGVGGEENGGDKTDQGEDGEGDHREDVGLIPRGEVGDQDGARDRGAGS